MPKGLQKVHPSFTARQLTHYGGLYLLYYFFNRFHLRRYLHRGLRFRWKHERYSPVDQLLLVLTSIIIGLERLAYTRLLHEESYVQYTLGLKQYPKPSTIRRFLQCWRSQEFDALVSLHDQLRQAFFKPGRTMIINLDTTVLPVYGQLEGTAVGYNPTKRGRPSYQAVLGTEAITGTTFHSELRSGKRLSAEEAITFLTQCFHRIPASVEEIRLRADAGFYSSKLIEFLEDRAISYAIVARVTRPIREKLSGLRYHRVTLNGKRERSIISLISGRRSIASLLCAVASTSSKMTNLLFFQSIGMRTASW